MSNPYEPQPRRGPRVYRPNADLVSVAAIVHKYPTVHRAGAEEMLHALLAELVRRGHRATVFVGGRAAMQYPAAATLDGVTVRRLRDSRVQLREVAADLVVTHLDLTRHAVVAASYVRAPVVHLLHNDNQLRYHRVRAGDADVIVGNAEWIAEAARRFIAEQWGGARRPVEVIHPPVIPDDYRVDRAGADRVTLVNLSPAKGGPLFWELARRLPHRRFLAVKGAYAAQTIPTHVPPNVDLIDTTHRIVDDVYRRTRVLLMPSSYESWGRCAIEAACSGIPTIAHATEGLVESLGRAGIFIDRDLTATWAARIDRLFDDELFYAQAGDLARQRAEALDPRRNDFDRWEKLVIATVRGEMQ